MLTSSSVMEVNQTSLASDNNGGAFDLSNAGSTGVDYTYGAAAQVVTVSVSGNGTATLTITSGTVTSTVLGNSIKVPGQGTFIITAYTATTLTVNTSNGTPGTFSSTVSYIGGPLASPGFAAGIMSNYNIMYLSGSFPISVATPNISNGVIRLASGAALIGYGTTRGDNLKATIVNSGLSSIYLMQTPSPNTYSTYQNLTVNGSSNSGVSGVTWWNSGANTVINCDFINCPGSGILSYNQQDVIMGCYFSGNGYGINGGNGKAIICVAVSSTYDGIYTSSAENCISIKNGGVGFGYSNSSSQISLFRGCTSAFNTSDGFLGNDGSAGSGASSVVNSLAWSNGQSIIMRNSSTYRSAVLSNNAVDTPVNAIGATQIDTITLTAQPFVNPTATINSVADAFAAFALNTAAGGGALCRGAGTPQYLDIGAVQSAPSAGGGGGMPPLWRPGFRK